MKTHLALLALCLVSCGDPLKDGIIAELGDEQDGFPANEFHRIGQPCLACHSEYEDAEPIMSIAGTLFVEPTDEGPLQPLPGYTIRIIDSRGQFADMATNRCGNFWVTEEEYEPAYPLRAEVFGPSLADPEVTTQVTVMATRIGRDGSCGSCHIHPSSPFSPGVAFVPEALLSDSVELPDPLSCPLPRFATTPVTPSGAAP